MLVGQDVLNRTAPPGIGLLGSIKIGASRGDAVAANGSDSSADKRLPAFGRRQRANSGVMGVGDDFPGFVAHDLHSGDLGPRRHQSHQRIGRMTTVQERRHKRGG